MIKAGIVEGSGYKAGELTRILLHHPDVELVRVTSDSHAGEILADVHRGLVGDTDLAFTPTPESLEELAALDVIFLCPGTPQTLRDTVSPSDEEGPCVIDLEGGDGLADYAAVDSEEPLPGATVYGLPERNRKPLVRGARRAVCPEPLAMALGLSLMPLARNLLLNADIHATAVTGSSVAGTSRREDPHTRRNDNVIPSALLTHDDLPEVSALLASMQTSFAGKIHLVELSGPFSRGVITVSYLDCPVAIGEIERIYRESYSDHNFTYLTSRMPDLKDVVNTNKCLLHLSKAGTKLVVVAVMDNLLKGAAGNAVHLMNLMFGLHERTGLDLKASAF